MATVHLKFLDTQVFSFTLADCNSAQVKTPVKLEYKCAPAKYVPLPLFSFAYLCKVKKNISGIATIADPCL